MHWRKATWALVVFNVLMLVWLITGIASTSGNATNCGSLDQQTCNAARDVGAGIGVTVIIVFWFIGFVVLGLVWLMSRPRTRLCPACGRDVKTGLTACKACGYSFIGGGVPSGGGVQYSPDGNYWWNGSAWVPTAAQPPPAPGA